MRLFLPDPAIEEAKGLLRTGRGGTEESAAPRRPRWRGAVLLQASGAQSGQAMRFKGASPFAELLFRQVISAAGFLEGDLAALHGGIHRGFAADPASSGIGRR
jgi:hypothetical protein